MASIPVLSSVADLLTKTVASEEFKKLFQPWALVAAAIFLAFNLLLVIPGLVSAGVAPLAALQRLPTIWQILIGTLVLTALGYLISSLGSSFVDLVSGNALRGSPIIYEWMLARQKRQFEKLRQTAKPNRDGETDRKGARALYTLALEYPDEKEALAPTRLGNILRNPASYAERKYGVHLDTVWPIMSLTLKNSDSELFGKVSDGSTRLTFLATVTVLLAVVAVELVTIGLIRAQPWSHFLGAALLLVLAYAVHLATCKEAKAWAVQMRTALDTHLDAVADRLKLRSLPAESSKDRKDRWEEVSRWLAYGGSRFADMYLTPEPKSKWYVAPKDSPDFEVKVPPTVVVENKRRLQTGAVPDPDTPRTRWIHGSVAEYTHLITNIDAGQAARVACGVHLMLVDAQLARDQVIQGRLAPGTETLAAHWLAGDPPTVLWDLGSIEPRSSLALTYRTIYMGAVEVEITSPDALVSIEKLELKESSPALHRYVVSLRYTAPAEKVQLKVTLYGQQCLGSKAILYAPGFRPIEFTNTSTNPSDCLREGELVFDIPGGTDLASLEFFRRG